VSFTCNFALQRLALRTKDWFSVVTAGLTGNAVTDTLPGGDAAGAAVQFRMLTTAGFDTDTAVGGLTAFSLLGVGCLLAAPRHRSQPAALPGAARLRRRRHHRAVPGHPGRAGQSLASCCPRHSRSLNSARPALDNVVIITDN
jgi:hypothetical protein